MRRLITAWREIVRDFSWPVLALILIYGAVSMVMSARSSDVYLLPDTVIGLIRMIGWLTIIAILVPQNSAPILVRQPVLEMVYLVVWGIVDAVALVYFWNLASSDSPYKQVVHYTIVFGHVALAVLFAVIFGYRARDVGIPFKHWPLYLGLVVLAFPIGKHLLQGEYYHMLIGAVSLVLLLVLFLSDRQRWHGLVDDLKSLRPYALPILLCALVTVVLEWGQDQSLNRFLRLLWSTPARIFDTPTVLAGAIPEEFYFRLGLQTRLTCLMPFGWASLLQGIAFKAYHIPQMLARGSHLSDIPWSFVPGIANALGGGYFWRRSRNLPAVVLFHMAAFI